MSEADSPSFNVPVGVELVGAGRFHERAAGLPLGHSMALHEILSTTWK